MKLVFLIEIIQSFCLEEAQVEWVSKCFAKVYYCNILVYCLSGRNMMVGILMLFCHIFFTAQDIDMSSWEAVFTTSATGQVLSGSFIRRTFIWVNISIYKSSISAYESLVCCTQTIETSLSNDWTWTFLSIAMDSSWNFAKPGFYFCTSFCCDKKTK